VCCPMRHYADRELERLSREHPVWEFWVVFRAMQGPVWCARPLGLTKPVLNADSPAELVKKLSDLH
jgi:hypothetical protein